MAGEQGANGGIESNRRQVRTNSDAEAVAENGVQSRTAGTDHYMQFSSQPAPSTAVAVAASPSRNPPNGSHYGDSSSSQHPLEPPVTKATLSELDVNKILQNPKLRHDINFDPDLHFRPNLDGEKGRRKQDKAQQFWNALLEQLHRFVTDRQAFRAEHGHGSWTLPSLLTAVKEIIQTLVPARDRVYLDEGLDVDLLMQQFDKGVADLEKLALWLSGVLKSHCAPMRDDWVDLMYNQLSNGNRENDLPMLVEGMKNLLQVLEAMKLDVANHQIRCLRPYLIEDTVHFEQRYQTKRITNRRLHTDTAKAWYRSAYHRHAPGISRSVRQDFGDTAVFFEGLLDLLMPSAPEAQISELTVFQFDEDRMLKLRADILDAINLEVCMRLYRKLEKSTAGAGHMLRSEEDRSLLQWSIENNIPSGAFLNYAASQGSRPSSFVHSDSGSATSSPRSSFILPTQTLADGVDARAKSRSLYKSLVALLHTAPPASRQVSRWQALAPDMALQILRATDVPRSVLAKFELEVSSHVCNADSLVYQDVERQFRQRLTGELARRVAEFKDLAGVNLFAVATGGRIHGPGRTWDGGRDDAGSGSGSSSRSSSCHGEDRGGGGGDADSVDGGCLGICGEDSGVEDMATRIAHLGILHWRVWSTIFYSRCLEEASAVGAHQP